MFTSSAYAALLIAVTAQCVSAGNSTATLDPNAVDCFITVPANPLTAEGLATPYLLQPPCSMAVTTQQAFAEAAVFDPATGSLSIYHPLVTTAGEQPAVDPVVPTLPEGAIVGLWFGFNGGTLQLLSADGQDANNSPELKAAECVNGLSGVQGDIFGQVSWCNAEQWFAAVNKGIKDGSVKIPDLGLDKNNNVCPTSRSFSITDADPSDNVPTQYILVGNCTAQDTDANRKVFNPSGEVITNASDEALLTNIIDPLIGCTPFQAPSLDNPGAMVSGLALSELQAALQSSPVAFVPLNDPDCLTTQNGKVSVDKTNIYRAGVNQPPIGDGETSGDLQSYCDGLVAGAPPFLKSFETTFLGASTPDAGVGNNLLTFLAGRYLSSLDILNCPAPAFQPIVCQEDGNGVATSCVINLANNGTSTSTKSMAAKETKTSNQGAKDNGDAQKGKTTSSSTSINTAASTDTTNAAAATGKGTAVDRGHKTLNTAAASAVTSNGVTNIIQVIEIEVVSFFVFVDNFGGHLPPAVLASEDAENHFVVIEEVFVEFAPAASRACNHQSSFCSSAAGRAGATFAVADCQAQEGSCLGVAATASVTASAPPTVTATATTVVATSAPTQITNVAAAQATLASAQDSTKPASSPVEDAADSGSSATNNPQCGGVTTVTVAAIPDATTLTTAMSGGDPTASAGLPYLHRHARHRRALGKY